VACSFKVLAHVPEIGRALGEMARVVRPGGYVLAEFYNPQSLRGVMRRFGPAGRIAQGAREHDVYTRFDAPSAVRKLVPPGCTLVATRGVRIVTPVAAAMRVPLLRSLLRRAERGLCDTKLSAFGGFFIAVFQKGVA
jgi:SAM-dependent methyltransferase